MYHECRGRDIHCIIALALKVKDGAGCFGTLRTSCDESLGHVRVCRGTVVIQGKGGHAHRSMRRVWRRCRVLVVLSHFQFLCLGFVGPVVVVGSGRESEEG